VSEYQYYEFGITDSEAILPNHPVIVRLGFPVWFRLQPLLPLRLGPARR
jgi:hypothetical protein